MPRLSDELRANAKERRELRKQAQALDAMLDAVPFEVLKDVLTKRGLLEQLIPQKEPKRDKLVTALTDSAPRSVCPKCGASEYQHYGKDRRGFPRYKCKDCGHTYGLSATSLVAGSGWSYEVWANFIHRTLMRESLAAIKQGLEEDFSLYTTEETLLAYRHRLYQFIALRWPMPVLNGVVKVDETFFREAQKGSRQLVNVSPKYIERREARVPEHKVPAEFGIQGPEYSCVVAGIDSAGHIAAVVTGLGRNTAKPFGEYFSEYLGNVEILCTDGFPVYSSYCEERNIVHYVQMSKWKAAIKDECTKYKERYKHALSEEEARRRLYGKGVVDFIENYPRRLSFEDFEALKAEKGLSLDRVDAVHSRMKADILTRMTNVSTVYLPGYIAFYCFRHNWIVDHGGREPSSQKAAEEIFKELLSIGSATNLSAEKKELLEMAAVPTRYVRSLALATTEMKKQMGDRGFTIGDGDVLLDFNKRKYFRNAPKSFLYEIAKEHHIKNHSKMGVERLAQEICKLPDADDIFLRAVASDGLHSKYLSDVKAIMARKREKDEEDQENKKRSAEDV